MEKLSLAKIFSWFKKFGDRDRAQWSPRPTRVWVMLLSLFVVLLVIAGSFSFYLYRRLVLPPPVVESKPPRTINEQELSKVLETFSDKDVVFKDLWQNPPKIVDPS